MLNDPTGTSAFLRGYLAAARPDECPDAEWSTEALAEARADCAAFASAHADDLELYRQEHGVTDADAGRAFWLTRNGQIGFVLDGDPACRRLHDAAADWPNRDPYLGGDGPLYFS
jgi:hypothetical protein